MSLSPLKMILIGLALAILGIVLPFLMVLHILESTFFLNFFSYGASLVGLFLGMIGSAMYMRVYKKKSQSVEPKDELAVGEDAIGSSDGNIQPKNDI
jgi:hypothetical protein